nr:reverse transcriptase domain-containing protein [Tanacetum cinerariifolium]
MSNNHNQEPPPQNGPPSMVRPNGKAPRTIEELCQPSINGRGGPIAPIPIQATDFGLRHHIIQQVQNTCQFHGLPGDDANRLIDKFLEITQHMKQNGVSDDALRLSHFPYSLTHHAIAWYDRLLRNSIHSFDNMVRNFLSKYFPPSMVTKLRNEIMKFKQKPHESLFEAWERYKLSIDRHGSLPSNTVPNPREDLKAITTRSGVTLAGPSVSPSSSKEVNREPDTITDQPKPTIPYPSRVNKHKLRENDDNLALKLVEIFRNLHFELSFADALLHMPKFALMFKSLLNNKEKLFDLATTSVNENCSAVILKKFLEKLGDPDKFLIPCDFPEFDECLALADLDVDYVVDPRVPLILRKPFLWTKCALIDVYGEELTLRVNDEAITFKVGQTSKYSYNDADSINRVDVIDIACEEYVQNPTPILDPIIALFSPSLTPFEGGDFILEEIEACLTSKSIPTGIDDTDLDLEGDIRLLEDLLNNDPSLSLLPPKNLMLKRLKPSNHLLMNLRN